jgi:hypothetical protein
LRLTSSASSAKRTSCSKILGAEHVTAGDADGDAVSGEG